MILIFNSRALLPCAFGGILGFLISLSYSVTPGILIGAALAFVVDLVQRFAMSDERAPLVNPNAGGHLYFMPVWVVGLVTVIMTGAVKAGMFSPREDPPPPVAVRRPPVPPPEVKPPQLLQPAEVKGGPKAVEVKRKPEFADAVVTPLALVKGEARVDGQLGPGDVPDRNAPFPVKVYELPLVAEQPYWLEVAALGRGVPPQVRLEDRTGKLLAAAQDDGSGRRSKLLYAPAAAEHTRIIVAASSMKGGSFTLKLKELAAGEVLPERERAAPPMAIKDEMQVALKTPKFLSAAVAADGTSAWLLFPGGKLQGLSCPDCTEIGTYVLPKQATQIALSGQGLLYVVVPKEEVSRPVRRPGEVAPADLHVYDTAAFAKAKAPLTPMLTLSPGGSVESLVLSPDDAWLYFVDTKSRKLRRVNLAAQKLDEQAADLVSDTTGLCVTPDGKTLYTCAKSNVVQKYDAAAFRQTATIRIDRGAPSGIQATDQGDIFLNGNEGAWSAVYLFNASRDPGPLPAKVTPWVGGFRPSAIALAPDQQRLYVACLSLSPSHIQAYPVGRWPGLYKAQECASVQLESTGARGFLLLSRDGRLLFCDGGRILRIER